jgi:hypothetical protein
VRSLVCVAMGGGNSKKKIEDIVRPIGALELHKHPYSESFDDEESVFLRKDHGTYGEVVVAMSKKIDVLLPNNFHILLQGRISKPDFQVRLLFVWLRVRSWFPGRFLRLPVSAVFLTGNTKHCMMIMIMIIIMIIMMMTTMMFTIVMTTMIVMMMPLLLLRLILLLTSA